MQSVKRLLLFLICLLASPLIARAQWPNIPIVQSSTNSASSGPTVTCVFNGNVTSGNIVAVAVVWNGTSATPSFSDTRTTTMTQKAADFNSPNGMDLYTGTLGSSGAETFTITLTSQNELGVTCMEFPPNWSLTVDTSAFSHWSGSPASVTSSTITTNANTDLLVSVFASFSGNGNGTVDSTSTGTFTQVGAKNGFFGSIYTAFGVAGTNGTYNIKWDTTGAAGTLLILAFTSNSLAVTSAATAPDGSLSNAYNYKLLAAGGKGAYTWSITSGALQQGLSLNSSTGAITGTPTSGPTNSITFQVADTNSHTASATISLKISTSANSAAFVQGLLGAGNASLVFGSNVTSGHLVTAVVAYGGNNNLSSVSYCTDTLSTPLVKIAMVALPNQSGGAVAPIITFAGIASSTGADTVSCPGGWMQAIAEVSGVMFAANDNVLNTIGTTATPATVTSGSLTTLVPNEILLEACGGYGGTWTVTSPFTSVGGTTNSGQNDGYDVVTTVTGYTASCSYVTNSTGIWGISLVGIRPSGGSAAPAPSNSRHRIFQSQQRPLETEPSELTVNLNETP